MIYDRGISLFSALLYWVNQGNECRAHAKFTYPTILPAIRNHGLGRQHKDNVTKRLNSMREEKAKKEKMKSKQLGIEAKAKRSYQKDVATFKEKRETNAQALDNESACLEIGCMTVDQATTTAGQSIATMIRTLAFTIKML